LGRRIYQIAQKQSPEKQVEALLQSIDPSKFADELLRHTLTVLLNVIEQQQLELKELREENQKLRDENNRLKGEQGKPEIKSNKAKGFKSNHLSEKERHTPKKHTKSSKNKSIKVDRTEILDYPWSKLPADAQFKGYEQVIIQDISLKTDNVLFRKEKYYSPSEGKTYLVSLPPGYDGEFGPGIKALVMSLYYGGNMTQGKLLEFLENIAISMSAGYLSNLLIKNLGDFEVEYNQVYTSGLESSSWQHIDQTSARVKGVNQTTNVICNPFYTVYSTTTKKDRLSVIGVLQNRQELEYVLNGLTFELLTSFNVPTKWHNQIKLLPQETVFTQSEFNSLWCSDEKLVTQLKRMRVLRRGTFLCLLLQLLVNWE
jgi:regulator of replication initiation timing